MPNARPDQGREADPFAGTGLETDGTAKAGNETDPFGWGYEAVPKEGNNGSGRNAGGTQGNEAGSQARTQESAGNSGEAGSESSGERGEGLGMGVGSVIGDAPPVPRPTPPGTVTVITETPRKRGRPPGSKNKGTNPNAPQAVTKESWFGGTPLPEVEARAAAEVIVILYRMPLKLAAKLKNNDAFDLDEKESKDIENAFTKYMMIRGDILGYWGPEIMLASTVGMPLYMRYLLWVDPSGTAAKALTEAQEQAAKGTPTP